MVKEIYIPIYNCKLHLIYDEPDIPKNIRKKFKQDWKKEEMTDIGRACFFTLLNPTDYAIWLIYNPMDLKGIVHEVSHLTRQILKDRQALSDDTDEPFCYLLEYLIDIIFKSLPKDYIKFGN